MPNYDTVGYDPPAPVADVILRDFSRGTLLHHVLVLLNTGADMTLLPRTAVEQLGVKPLADAARDT